MPTVKWKWMLLGFGLLALVTAALLIWGIASHKEAGFDEGAPQWESADFPLSVEAWRYNAVKPERVQDDELGAAMGWATTRLGFSAFRWADPGEPGQIHVTLGAPVEPGWQDPGGHSELAHVEGRAVGCNVLQANTGGAEDLTTLVLYHELGHCLGLAHDDFEASVMCGGDSCTLGPTPRGEIPVWFTDFDRQLIRDRYLN